MNASAGIQMLEDSKGKPAFAVLSYAEYLNLTNGHGNVATPDDEIRHAEQLAL